MLLESTEARRLTEVALFSWLEASSRGLHASEFFEFVGLGCESRVWESFDAR